MSESPLEIPSVEEPIVTPRSREVWMPDEQKIINRAVRLFLSRGVSVDLHCTAEDCSQNYVTREANESGFDLVCGCKRRVFNRPAQHPRRHR